VLAQISPAVVTVGGSGGGDLEALFKLFEKFLPQLERFSASIMKMRKFEMGNVPGAQAVESGPPSADDRPQGIGVPTGGKPGGISALEVYALALGAMAKLPLEMTVGEALQLARDRKGFIVSAIQSEIARLETS